MIRKITPAPWRRHQAGMTFSLLASVFMAHAVGAEDFDIRDYCENPGADGLQTLAEKLEGEWQARFQAGYVVFGQMAMPHPPSGEVETGRLEARDGGMVLIPDGAGMEMTFRWAGDATWRISDRPTLPEGTKRVRGLGKLGAPAVNGDDLSILAGCPLNDLPRMVGEGSVTRKGVTADFTLRAIVIDADLIYAFQQVNATMKGKNVLERRPMVMSRN